MLNAAASASTPSSASTGATVPTGAPATGWTMSGRLLDDPSASPATRATVEPRTQWTRWTQFAQPFAVATAERTQRRGGETPEPAARFRRPAKRAICPAPPPAPQPWRWWVSSARFRWPVPWFRSVLPPVRALAWIAAETGEQPAIDRRRHRRVETQSGRPPRRAHRPESPATNRGHRRLSRRCLGAAFCHLAPEWQRFHDLRRRTSLLPQTEFPRLLCALASVVALDRSREGFCDREPFPSVARRRISGPVERITDAICRFSSHSAQSSGNNRSRGLPAPEQKRPPGANQGAPTARVEPCLEAVLNANEVIMPCHVPSASEPKRRRRPSLLKSPPQSPPRIMATLDLSKPIERATHDFLRRASSGRWPMWRLLGAMRREGARLFVAVEWLRSAGESPFCIVELALDQQAVSWQYLPSAKAARAAVATAKPSALVAASAKNRTPHGQ